MAATDTPYAYIPDGATIRLVGALPLEWERLSDRVLITDLPNKPVAVQESTGWFLIDSTTNPRPAETATTTWSSGFVVINGRPVEQWTSVAKTPKQIEGETRTNKAGAISANVKAAYTRLQQIAAYVPPAITSNAIAQTELAKTMAAVQDIAVDLKGLARLLLGAEMLDADKD